LQFLFQRRAGGRIIFWCFYDLVVSHCASYASDWPLMLVAEAFIFCHSVKRTQPLPLLNGVIRNEDTSFVWVYKNRFTQLQMEVHQMLHRDINPNFFLVI
jgi:hypothetical protein